MVKPLWIGRARPGGTGVAGVAGRRPAGGRGVPVQTEAAVRL